MASNKEKKTSVFWTALFALYLAVLLYGLFFAEGLRDLFQEEYRYNLQPFYEITRYIHYAKTIGYDRVALNLLGNVMIFMPLGYFVPKMFAPRMKWWQMMLVAMATSTAVEVTQLVTKVGSCDVDDVILNTLGGVLGFCIYAGIRRYKKHHRKSKRKNK